MNIKKKYAELSNENVHEILREEIGIVFKNILEHAGVFKRDSQGQQAFKEFMNHLSNKSMAQKI
ncbi:hypothetical protein P4561_13830 [Priestia flexa]|uniref:hypothetical protein n=1 Tax=Priestia flexa TaxID=86664 RepID=UPI0012FD9BF6|nr:hypothetical protein [Priestia flexa]MED3824775.1 hypothetical protein [Priestia flexa]